MKFVTKTLQQETAYKQYEEQLEVNPNQSFEEWYRYWCYENSCFCDL